MIPQGLYQDVARSVSQDNERKIAAKELRRLAKAAGPTGGSRDLADRVVTACLTRVSAIRSVIGATRPFGQLLAAVGRRRMPA